MMKFAAVLLAFRKELKVCGSLLDAINFDYYFIAIYFIGFSKLGAVSTSGNQCVR